MKKMFCNLKKTKAILTLFFICVIGVSLMQKPVDAQASSRSLTIRSMTKPKDEAYGYIWVSWQSDTENGEFRHINVYAVDKLGNESVVGAVSTGTTQFWNSTHYQEEITNGEGEVTGHRWVKNPDYDLTVGDYAFDPRSNTYYAPVAISVQNLYACDGEIMVCLMENTQEVNVKSYNFPISYFSGYIRNFQIDKTGAAAITWTAPKSLRTDYTEITVDVMAMVPSWYESEKGQVKTFTTVHYPYRSTELKDFKKNTRNTVTVRMGNALGLASDYRPDWQTFFCTLGMKSFNPKTGRLCYDRYANPKLRTASFTQVRGEKYGIRNLKVDSITTDPEDIEKTELDVLTRTKVEVKWSVDQIGFDEADSLYSHVLDEWNRGGNSGDVSMYHEGTIYKREGKRVFYKADWYALDTIPHKLYFMVSPNHDDIGSYGDAFYYVTKEPQSWKGIDKLQLMVPYMTKECPEGEHDYEITGGDEDGCEAICQKCGKMASVPHEYDSGDVYQTNCSDGTHFRTCIHCNYVDEHSAESTGDTIFVNPKQFMYCRLPVCATCHQGIEPDLINGSGDDYEHEWEFVQNPDGKTHITKCKNCRYEASDKQDCFNMGDYLLNEGAFLDTDDMERIGSRFSREQGGSIILTCACGRTKTIQPNGFTYDTEDVESVSFTGDEADSEDSDVFDSLRDGDGTDRKLDVASSDEAMSREIEELNENGIKDRIGDDELPADPEIRLNKKCEIEVQDDRTIEDEDGSFVRRVRYKTEVSSVLTVKDSHGTVSEAKVYPKKLDIDTPTIITVMLPDDFGAQGDSVKVTDVKNAGISYGTLKQSESGAMMLTFYSANGVSVFDFENEEGSDLSEIDRRISNTYKGGTICFDKNGGSGSMADQTVAASQLITQEIEGKSYATGISCETIRDNVFTRDGYVFGCWNTAADGSGTAYADKGDIRLNGDVTLYAQWKKLAVITYDKNDVNATGSMEAQTAVSGNSVILKKNGFTRKNFAVTGWNTEADRTGTEYALNAVAVFTEDTTLYAQWTDNTAVITFDPGAEDYAGSMNPQTVEKSKATALDENVFTREGKMFTSWNTKADGSGISYADGAEITATGDMTLYAQWSEDYVTITYYPNGAMGSEITQKVSRGSKVSLKQECFTHTNNSLSFAGWNTRDDDQGTYYESGAQIVAAEDMYLYARWKATVTITFYAYAPNDGTKTQQVLVGTPTKLIPNPYKKDGYIFDKWAKGSNVSEVFLEDEAEITVYQDTELHAQWIDNRCKITFDRNGATQGMNYQYIPRGVDTPLNKCEINPDVTEDKPTYGKKFGGWNTKADGSGVSYADEAVVNFTDESVTLYAQWIDNMLTVTFYANDGTDKKVTQTVHYGDLVDTTPNSFVREGYGFKNWNTQADGKGSGMIDGASTRFYKDAEYYVVWTKLNTVTFDKNADDAYGTMKDVYVYPNSDVYPNDPEKGYSCGYRRDGWIFEGWGSKANATVPLTSLFVFEDKTVYAIWKQNTKVNVSSLMTFGNEYVTYDGSPKEYTGAGISFEGQTDYTEGTDGQFTYTYYEGTKEIEEKKLPAGTYPTKAGSYAVRVNYEDSNNYGSRYVILTIRKVSRTLAIDTSQLTLYGADGEINLTIGGNLSEEDRAKLTVYSQPDSNIAELGEFTWNGNKCTIPVVYRGKGYTHATFSFGATDDYYGASAGLVFVARDGYDIRLSSPDGGKLKTDAVSAKAGADVSVTAVPKTGYSTESVTVTNRNTGEGVPVSNGSFTMPDSPVDISAVFKKDPYLISYASEGRVVFGDGLLQAANYGDAVRVEAVNSDENKAIAYFTIEGDDHVSSTVKLNADGSGSFKMPAKDITVKAVLRTLNSVSVNDIITGGSLYVSAEKAVAGTKVTVTPVPSDGYAAGAITYTEGSTEKPVNVSVDENGEITYFFIMPDEATVISAEFLSDSAVEGVKNSVNDSAQAEKGETVAEVPVTVDDDTKETLQSAAGRVSVDITPETDGVAISDEVKTEALKALTQAGISTIDNGEVKVGDSTATVRVVDKTFMDVRVVDYDDKGEEILLTFDITPMKQRVATVAAADTILNDENCVPLSKAEKLEVNGDTMVTVGISDALAGAAGGAGKTIYVRHTHAGRTYEYPAAIGGSAGAYTASFENPDGFSEFTLSVQTNTVASFNDGTKTRYYPSFSEAVADALKNGINQITMHSMPKGSDTATIKSAPLVLYFSQTQGAQISFDALYDTWLIPAVGIERASTSQQLADNIFEYKKGIAGSKVTPEVTAPTAGAITVGQTLADSNLTGGSASCGGDDVKGTFAWADATTVPKLEDSNSRDFELIFSPENYGVYESVALTVKVTVNDTVDTDPVKVPESTPTAVFAADGYDSGVLTGLVNGCSYKLTGVVNSTFTAAGTTHVLTGVTAGKLSVVRLGDGVTTDDSRPLNISITRAATPELIATQPQTADGTGSIPTAASHQKSADGTTWEDCSGPWTNLAAGTYYVRAKAYGSVLSSEVQTIIITAPGGGGGSGSSTSRPTGESSSARPTGESSSARPTDSSSSARPTDSSSSARPSGESSSARPTDSSSSARPSGESSSARPSEESSSARPTDSSSSTKPADSSSSAKPTDSSSSAKSADSSSSAKPTDSSSSAKPTDSSSSTKPADSSSSAKTVTEKSAPVEVQAGGQTVSVTLETEHLKELVYRGSRISPEDLEMKTDTTPLEALVKSLTGEGTDVAGLFTITYKTKNKGDAGEALFTPKIKFDAKRAKQLNLGKDEIKAIKKAVAALNKDYKNNPVKADVIKANLADVFDSLDASIDAKGRLKVKTMTALLGGKVQKLKKKKDYQADNPDTAAGTVVIKGVGINFEGSVTVEIATGKKI